MTGTAVGFLGLGRMGEPMAARLVLAGTDVVAWNRSDPPLRRLQELGAATADSPAEVFERCSVVLMMLADAGVADEVLGREGDRFAAPVAGRTVVQMGTVSPESSAVLGRRVAAAGGRYVEAPVSGSRVPAERGELVAMLAGDPDDVARVRPVVAPMCASVVDCGPVPRGLETKLAVNVFLIAMVTGLAEAVHLAESSGVDLGVLQAVLDAGPMASAVSRGKMAKLVEGDHEAQASVRDVHYNSRLILELAASTGASTPLIRECARLLAGAERLGLGSADMVAVVDALREGSPA
ncbi:NAD(P)-dependent oxidoreductase [Nocardioides sp.]|uniref:NAD(P)-dependent oxidoreductase n=1 Tax=Nocardioides sp. TaxID=35761 RepID=UPI003783487F